MNLRLLSKYTKKYYLHSLIQNITFKALRSMSSNEQFTDGASGCAILEYIVTREDKARKLTSI